MRLTLYIMFGKDRYLIFSKNVLFENFIYENMFWSNPYSTLIFQAPPISPPITFFFQPDVFFCSSYCIHLMLSICTWHGCRTIQWDMRKQPETASLKKINSSSYQPPIATQMCNCAIPFPTHAEVLPSLFLCRSCVCTRSHHGFMCAMVLYYPENISQLFPIISGLYRLSAPSSLMVLEA